MRLVIRYVLDHSRGRKHWRHRDYAECDPKFKQGRAKIKIDLTKTWHMSGLEIHRFRAFIEELSASHDHEIAHAFTPKHAMMGEDVATWFEKAGFWARTTRTI